MPIEEMIALLQAQAPGSIVELRLEIHVVGENGTEFRQYVSGSPRKVFRKRELTELDIKHGRKPVVIIKG